MTAADINPMDTITDDLRAAAALIRLRGHNRTATSNPTVGPVSTLTAVQLATAARTPMMRGNTVQHVSLYWTQQVGLPLWMWEHANADRDVTAEAADHLDAAADWRFWTATIDR